MINFFNRLGQILANIYELLIRLIKEQYAWVLILIGIIIGFIIGIIIIKVYFRKDKREKSKLLNSTLNKFLHEKNKADAILSDLDVGILAYGSDGFLINYNASFCKIMQIEEPPDTFKDFLMEFGKDNGLQAGVMLGTGINEVLLDRNDKNIKIKLKNTKFKAEKYIITIISAQDITQQEQENKRRKEFVANVSHELRTPLTTIKAYTESLLDWGIKEKKKESIRKDVLRIHEDSIRMETLVDNLLLLSRIDNKGIVSGMEQHELETIARSVVERLLIQAEEKNIILECYSLGKLPWIFVDRSRIDRVLLNIISNAIKYTEENGKVSVYLGILVDDVYVKVSDTGYGIEKDKIPYIFDRFYRVDMTGSRMYGGTGLGLAIAKELIDFHKGDISVVSTLGKGTDFIIRIPTARKLFKNAIEYIETGSDETDIYIYKAAVEILHSRAVEIGMELDELSSLSFEQSEELIDKTIYDVAEES